jgi:hypothetical protein
MGKEQGERKLTFSLQCPHVSETRNESSFFDPDGLRNVQQLDQAVLMLGDAEELRTTGFQRLEAAAALELVPHLNRLLVPLSLAAVLLVGLVDARCLGCIAKHNKLVASCPSQQAGPHTLLGRSQNTHDLCSLSMPKHTHT